MINTVIKAKCQNIFTKLFGFKFIASITTPRNLKVNRVSLLDKFLSSYSSQLSGYIKPRQLPTIGVLLF